jgi:hypothetical protein
MNPSPRIHPAPVCRPVVSVALAALGLLGALAATPAAAASATQTHSTGFTAAGGDVRYGNGDTSTTSMVTGILPLFDTALGTLERVDLELAGWRSIAFTCTTGAAGTPGGCNARASGDWILDSVNYAVWSFATLATLRTEAAAATGVAPPSGTSLSAVSLGTGELALSFTDPLLLERHFSNATASSPNVDLRLRFAGTDGGGVGQGGASAITSLVWDGDATLSLTYHYVSAVPEPATWASLAAGLGVLGWLRRRRL